MFHIGQRVVCIPRDDESKPYDWDAFKRGVHALEVGRIYTIRDIDHRGVDQLNWDEPAIRLEEIINPVLEDFGPWEVGYSPRRFRPLAETEVKSEMETTA